MSDLMCDNCYNITYYDGDWRFNPWECGHCGKIHLPTRKAVSDNKPRENSVSFVNGTHQPNRLLKVRGIYRHYKSGLEYKVLDIGDLEKDRTPMVMYQEQYGAKKKWIRPISEFLGPVEVGGNIINRFEHVR